MAVVALSLETLYMFKSIQTSNSIYASALPSCVFSWVTPCRIHSMYLAQDKISTSILTNSPIIESPPPPRVVFYSYYFAALLALYAATFEFPSTLPNQARTAGYASRHSLGT